LYIVVSLCEQSDDVYCFDIMSGTVHKINSPLLLLSF
jgi:hypothetical protein